MRQASRIRCATPVVLRRTRARHSGLQDACEDVMADMQSLPAYAMSAPTRMGELQVCRMQALRGKWLPGRHEREGYRRISFRVAQRATGWARVEWPAHVCSGQALIVGTKQGLVQMGSPANGIE
jgi:hypothetical protein